MRLKNFLLTILLSCTLSILSNPNSAITSMGWNGRFGDQLFLYTETKWLSYKHGLQFFYRPFPYSDRLVLHSCEKRYNTAIERNFKNKIKLHSERDIKNNEKEPILYECDFFAEVLPDFNRFPTSHISRGRYHNLYEIIIQNPSFAELLKELIQPLEHLPTPELPKNKITVAVHIRKGMGDPPLYSEQLFKISSGIDKTLKLPSGLEYVDVGFPHKFPTEQYYIDQLKKLYTLLDNKELYVYIFTDDPNAKRIVNYFERECNNSNITFSCNEYNTSHDKNVIKDFWTMTKFDCLIRGQSSYSVMAQYIGNHKIIIEPWSYHWEGKRLIMDNIKIVLPDYKERVVHYYSFDPLNSELKIIIKNIFETKNY